MGFEQTSCERSTPNPLTKVGGQPCPVCGGLLVPLRNVLRCSRCYFSLCVGCESEPVATGAEDE